MERTKILQKIKDTELEIQKKIEKTNYKKIETIEKAKKLAKKIEQESEIKARKENEELIKTERNIIEKEKNKIIEKGNSEADILRKSANIKEAKKLFIIKFEECINV